MKERKNQKKIALSLHASRPLVSVRKLVLNQKFDKLEKLLEAVPLKTCYRKFIKMEWSFHIGYTSFTFGAKSFTTPHPIQTPPYQSLGICTTPPLEKPSTPPYQKILFSKGTEIMKLVDPEFVSKHYVVHFSKMSSSSHEVPLHVDDHDIAPQYIVYLGNWTGAELRAYQTTKVERTSTYHSLSSPRQFLYLDGRLAHELVKYNFQGVRYVMIVYQLWREDKLTPDPYLFPPQLIEI